MRAAKTMPIWQPKKQTDRQPVRLPKILASERGLEWSVGLGSLFLIGYIGGILLCREQAPDFGSVLAQYYMDKQNYLSLAAGFGAEFSALFLQAGIILLCGSSALGGGLLAVCFAATGTLLGICAASVFLNWEARGLIVYWLLTSLPNTAALILLLWLARDAANLSGSLFYAMFNGAGTRGAPERRLRALLLRYLLTLAIGAVCMALSAAASGLFASVLL